MNNRMDCKESPLADTSDLLAGQMEEVSVGETRIPLARIGDHSHAFYVKDDRVLAVAGMSRDREMAAAEELIRLGCVPTPDQFKGGGVSLLEILHNPVLVTA
jgi:hypothetical protein